MHMPNAIAIQILMSSTSFASHDMYAHPHSLHGARVSVVALRAHLQDPTGQPVRRSVPAAVGLRGPGRASVFP